MTNRKVEYWVIPPEQDAEFVAAMEDVLEIYAKAYDPEHPVLCMDEKPFQLLKETQVPIPATKTHGERVDYEYERNGTASIFLFAEPLSGFRQATARPQRTKADWAIEVAAILDTRYVNNDLVTLVCDNLNTHTKGAFYEVFDPAKARAYVRRLGHLNPKTHSDESSFTRGPFFSRSIGRSLDRFGRSSGANLESSRTSMGMIWARPGRSNRLYVRVQNRAVRQPSLVTR